jgi:hypothetical protein
MASLIIAKDMILCHLEACEFTVDLGPPQFEAASV